MPISSSRWYSSDGIVHVARSSVLRVGTDHQPVRNSPRRRRSSPGAAWSTRVPLVDHLVESLRRVFARELDDVIAHERHELDLVAVGVDHRVVELRRGCGRPRRWGRTRRS